MIEPNSELNLFVITIDTMECFVLWTVEERERVQRMMNYGRRINVASRVTFSVVCVIRKRTSHVWMERNVGSRWRGNAPENFDS